MLLTCTLSSSAILVVAGATLSNTPGAADADLFSIYDLLKAQLSTVAATIFALALLFSGQTAGLVVTLAGQMVSEGHISLAITPWKRRLVTRTIAVVPALVVAASVGRGGLGTVLNASQVALSVILPVVSAPLIWFTSRSAIMSVSDESLSPNRDGEAEGSTGMVDLSNSWGVAAVGGVIWLCITALNMVSLGLILRLHAQRGHEKFKSRIVADSLFLGISLVSRNFTGYGTILVTPPSIEIIGTCDAKHHISAYAPLFRRAPPTQGCERTRIIAVDSITLFCWVWRDVPRPRCLISCRQVQSLLSHEHLQRPLQRTLLMISMQIHAASCIFLVLLPYHLV